MYDYIIVPFDGTADARRAATMASDIAKLADAELVIATVGASVPPSLGGALKQRATSASDDLATIWLEPAASPVDGLATMTSYRANSLICMHTHARTGLLRAVYGSLADELLERVDAPLLLLGPHCRDVVIADTRHVVVCVDRSEKSEAAVSIASTWAELFAVNATVVYLRQENELVANIDELIAPLEARCGIVEKVVVEPEDHLSGLLDIIEHGINTIVVLAERTEGSIGRFHHSSLTAMLSRTSPVPVLVQGLARTAHGL